MCRWRVLLEYFEEPLPFEGERCGLCDDCLRLPAAEQPAAAAAAQAPVARALPRWQAGAAVSVQHEGRCVVRRASVDEVEVQCADGSLRCFVADHVLDAADPHPP